MRDELGCLDRFKANGKEYGFYSLPKLAEQHEQVRKLPFSLRILLENLMRHEDGRNITADDVAALANWDPKADPSREISFTPARVVLQDFTGVPAIVDLAAMREAMKELGGKADRINPLSPAELVIDHSIQVDSYGQANSLDLNNEIEFKRNKERYAFLRWGQGAFDNFKVVPPNTGIVHQVNLEHLSRVVFDGEVDGQPMAWPDTLVGTDSHTTMINGLGILGWGVGGIEAEAAMLGQPISMLIPQVIGFKLTGKLPEGTTATDLVLTITEMLREKGVVGKFVEFFGNGLSHLPLADRATIGNMSPEFGSTCAIFPIDQETIRYLELSGRSKERLELVETYARAQDFWRDDEDPDPVYSDVLELDLGDVVPSLAGPKRPQDRVLLSKAKNAFLAQLSEMTKSRDSNNGSEVGRFNDEGGRTAVGATEIPGAAEVDYKDQTFILKDGAVVIAAITSCTNTSNPAVMLGAGILARNAREKGLTVKPWVKTSLAPGSKVVTDYLEKSGLDDDLEALGFYTVGYGCTTCIGNSGPLPEPIDQAVREHEMVVCSVLSGNRNFEGRIHPEVKMNYLASPPLVVAYAIAGRMDLDLVEEPLGEDPDGNPVYLKDVWPDAREIQDFIQSNVTSEMFSSNYKSVFEGDELWNSMDTPTGEMFEWDDDSTYVRNPPYFEGMTMDPDAIGDIKGARVLAKLGDSVTTDHISPAGAIKPDSPAGRYLQEQGIKPVDFNSYGSRRGNHEVMMRGTFANVRIKNQIAEGTEGGFTTYFPDSEVMPIYDAAVKYQEDGTPLVVIAGKEYGSGSSRDWAAKGTRLLGVKAVIAASFERIHRSNLIGMGVLPLTFAEGEDADSLGLDGTETFDITGLEDGSEKEVEVKATHPEGKETTFKARVRLDTPKEIEYYKHGGILHYVLRDMAKAA
ncbi:aconitate hydratase AcnA [Wenzhouxiangella sp. XN201]|uniref:aconitate hydratase AcnA n=1 Tax=Wenzhouxiangella sp. XN201 TaxID=2710755 RepID=UPI0013C93DB4|nr:aconitate hydratase AcnA [Wenzhouxiangella sp. XN201]NEZ03752.1 aconitate hydratase AcnA [Wenzhouxiangella sp. XN201]